jgi:nucleoside-diphosphate-sugar epimerase
VYRNETRALVRKLLITGAAGYVGSLLRRGLLHSDPELEIVALDLKVPDQQTEPRVHWIRGDVTAGDWHREAAAHGVDAVVHLAVVVREPLGERARQYRINVDGTRLVRDFALATPTVRRLVHFSTISVYADTEARGMEVPLDETASVGAPIYSYARDKVEAEALFADTELFDAHATQAIVLRPASISGPLGRFERGRYGLMSTLKAWSPFLVAGSKRFGRQFLHEEDIVGVVERLLAAEFAEAVTLLNASPEDFLELEQMADILEKRPLVVPPTLMRFLFAAAWYGSAGRVPMSPGAWMMLTHAQRMSGEALVRRLGYRYRSTSAAALAGSYLPPETSPLLGPRPSGPATASAPVAYGDLPPSAA